MQTDHAYGKSSSALILVAGLATAALGLALARGWEPGIEGEWVWRRNELPAHLWGALAAGGGLAGLGAILCHPGTWERMTRSRRAMAFALLLLLVFLLQLSLLNAVGVPWVAPGGTIISPNATTYFAVSLGVQSPRDWIAHYPEVLPTLPYHAATHPPGFVLLFWSVRKLTALMPSPPSTVLDVLVQLGDVLGMRLAPSDALAAITSALLIALIGALGLIPLHLLARSLAGRQTAICATCLAAAMPGLVLLGASPDLIVMTLAIGAMYRAYAGYRGDWASALLGGVIIAVGLFLSLAFALVGLWALIWAVLGIARSPHRAAAVRGVLSVALVAAAGFAAVYLALYLAAGYRPLAVAVQALSAHRGVTTIEAARTYWKWVLMNPVDCAIFAGIPAVVGACWSLPALRRAQHGRLASFLAAWLVLFVLLDLSGMVRGEVGRIWLFLLWPAGIAAGAAVSARADSGRATALLVLVQVAQALMMKGYLTMYSIL
jgi:hypothetical protein